MCCANRSCTCNAEKKAAKKFSLVGRARQDFATTKKVSSGPDFRTSTAVSNFGKVQQEKSRRAKMARKSKARKQQSTIDKSAAKQPNDGNPKSMVIRIGAGEVGASVTQLVKDVRQLMQPDTAVRLKVYSTSTSHLNACLLKPCS